MYSYILEVDFMKNINGFNKESKYVLKRQKNNKRFS